jgi:P-type conjugative transfer protein TrbG
MRFTSIFILSGFVLGCTTKPPVTELPLTPANHVVEKTVEIPPPALSMVYHLTSANNPALLKAYQLYQKTGAAKTIETEQFVQFPYDVGAQPVINASILELTVISLENGETVNSVSSGDPLRWSYSLVYSGEADSRQAHVLLKPAKSNISTDLFITTDRRAYLLKLVSTANGKYVREVRFWYPDAIKANWSQYNLEKTAEKKSETVVSELPSIDVSQLNFNYRWKIQRKPPAWAPLRVFDDGVHTYIQLAPSVSSSDLPALFVENDHTREIVNYRVKMPYFVIDKIFSKAVMISGVGRNQQRVTIIRGV